MLGGLQVHANIAAADQNANGNLPGNSGAERPVGLGARYAAGPLAFAIAYDRNANDLKTKGIYGSYNFGAANVMFQWENGDVSPSADQSLWSIGARVPMGAATFKVGYRNNSDAEQKKFGAGLDYNLSKRTIVYTDVAKQSGDGYSATAKKAQFDVGIWHKF